MTAELLRRPGSPAGQRFPITGRAVRWHGPGDLRLEEVQIPAPGPDEVVVAVAFCGVCGSDVHEVADGPHAIPVGTPHTMSRAQAPITLGHEFSGVVVATGTGVTGVHRGSRVAVEPNYRCGECTACVEGRYEVCAHFGFAGLMGDGGMADYAVLPSYMIHPLPEAFDLAAAAVLEPAAVALHSIRQSSFRQGDSVLVVGLGPVGLLVCALLTEAGVVIGVDPRAERRHRANALGVIAVDSADDVAERCRLETGGAGVHVAFEAVGTQQTINTALQSLRSGGEAMLLGLTDHVTIPVFDMINSELRITTSVGYRDCHAELVERVVASQLDLAALVTDIVNLEEAPQTLAAMVGGATRGMKTLIRCNPIDPSELDQ